MVTITDAHLRATIYETIYDLISANKNTFFSELSDSSDIDPALFGGFPDEQDESFPMMIIMPVNVSEDEYTIDEDRTVSDKGISIDIVPLAKKNKHLDYLSDGITDTIKHNPFPGAFLSSIAEEFNVEFPLDQKIKSKTLTINFKRR